MSISGKQSSPAASAMPCGVGEVLLSEMTMSACENAMSFGEARMSNYGAGALVPNRIV